MNIYEINDIGELIKDNSYVGRGIVIGLSADATKAVSAYFIMGRSENSRNRIFVEKDNGEVMIYPYDESKVEDPSLIIYSPIRIYENNLIVTNGDQTDTVYDGLVAGKSFAEALKSRKYEPDAPNLTPRISGMLTFDQAASSFTYQMSILKSADPEGRGCNRYTYEYEPIEGLGHFIHTYICDGNPIPTFCGEPERVAIPDDIDQFTEKLWNNLNEANKISLYVRYTDLESGKETVRMINKNA